MGKVFLVFAVSALRTSYGYDCHRAELTDRPIWRALCRSLAAVLAKASRDKSVDEVIEQLLGELKQSPTDLAKLVKTVHGRTSAVVAINPRAIARWQRDDPGSWARVQAWLTQRGVRILDV